MEEDKWDIQLGPWGSWPALRRFERALGVYETMINEGCHADEKFYAVLARGCVQLHQPLKAHPMGTAGTSLRKGMAHGVNNSCSFG